MLADNPLLYPEKVPFTYGKVLGGKISGHMKELIRLVMRPLMKHMLNTSSVD